MNYVSLDIETTGLEKWVCEVLTLGAVIDNDKTALVDDLPKFHVYIRREDYRGEAYALGLNGHILKKIAEMEVTLLKDINYGSKRDITGILLEENDVANVFNNWLEYNMGRQSSYIAAGKNASSFDIPFLNTLPEFKELVKFKHRVLDPGSMFARKGMEKPPSLGDIKSMIGIGEDVAHDALEDAMDVVYVIRWFFSNVTVKL